MTDADNRRFLHLAQAAAHLSAAARLVLDVYPIKARELQDTANAWYAEAAPLIGAPVADPRFEHEDERAS